MPFSTDMYGSVCKRYRLEPVKTRAEGSYIQGCVFRGADSVGQHHLRTDPTTLKCREQANAVSGTATDASTHVGRTSMEDIFLDPGIGT